MTTLREGNLQITFPRGAKARKFGDGASHGLSHVIGVPWLATVASMELGKAVAVSTVFIPGDLAKAVVASFAALIVKRSYPLIRA